MNYSRLKKLLKTQRQRLSCHVHHPRNIRSWRIRASARYPGTYNLIVRESLNIAIRARALRRWSTRSSRARAHRASTRIARGCGRRIGIEDGIE